MDKFIFYSLVIVSLNFVLLTTMVIVLAWFDYFPQPGWMVKMKNRPSK